MLLPSLSLIPSISEVNNDSILLVTIIMSMLGRWVGVWGYAEEVGKLVYRSARKEDIDLEFAFLPFCLAFNFHLVY